FLLAEEPYAMCVACHQDTDVTGVIHAPVKEMYEGETLIEASKVSLRRTLPWQTARPASPATCRASRSTRARAAATPSTRSCRVRRWTPRCCRIPVRSAMLTRWTRPAYRR